MADLTRGHVLDATGEGLPAAAGCFPELDHESLFVLLAMNHYAIHHSFINRRIREQAA